MEVTLTGTGYPIVDPLRAGPGTLVRAHGRALQFDSGRGTALRLAACGVGPEALTALFVTHHHFDHLTDLADILLSRWIAAGMADLPLPVVAPEGPALTFVERALAAWEDDIAIRNLHVGLGAGPRALPLGFAARDRPQEVWREGEVRVSAVLVDHAPVRPAVGYRVETPAGVVVISGDTIVCPAVEELGAGADVLVHEVYLRAQARERPASPIPRYHADAVELGAMAARLRVPILLLTHLIPAPNTPELVAAFEAEIAEGGYRGHLVVGRDLTTVDVASGTVRTAGSVLS